MKLTSPEIMVPTPLADVVVAPAGTPTLLFSTAPFFLRPIAEAFQAAADAGFSSVEVMVTRDLDSQRAGSLAAAAARYDVAIGALHAPFLAMTRSVFGTDPIGKVTRTVGLAQDLGVRTVIAHPPYRWQSGYARWLDASLPAITRRTGVVVTVENMCPVGAVSLHRHTTVDRLGEYPDLTFDTSHAGVAGVDLHEVAQRHAQHLRHVHLSDNRGTGWDSHALIGQGILPIDHFLDTLSATGFSGHISLELNLRHWLDDRAGMRRVLRAQRQLVESLLPALARS